MGVALQPLQRDALWPAAGRGDGAWWLLPPRAAWEEGARLCGAVLRVLPVVRHLRGLGMPQEAWGCIDSLIGGNDGTLGGGGEGGGDAASAMFDGEPTLGQLVQSPLLQDARHREAAMGLSNVVTEWLTLD